MKKGGEILKENYKTYLKFLFSFKGAKKYFGMAIVATVLHSAFDFAPTWLVMKLFGVIFDTKNLLALVGLAVGIVVTYILASVMFFTKEFSVRWLGAFLNYTLRIKIFEKLLKLPPYRKELKDRGNILNLASADLEIIQGIYSSIIDVIGRTLFLIMTLGFMLYLNWRLLLFSLATLPIVALIVRKLTTLLKRHIAEARIAYSSLLNRVNVAIDAVDVVNVYRKDEFMKRFLEKIYKDYLKKFLRSVRVVSLLSPSIQITASVGIAFILIVGGKSVFMGVMKPQELMAFLIAMARALLPAKRLTSQLGNFENYKVVFGRLNNYLNLPECNWNEGQELKGEFERLNFEEVKVGIGDKLILREVNFEVKKGEFVSIVGQSGEGKSTLLRVIMKMFPYEGKARVNGIELKDVAATSLWQKMAYIPQFPVFFDASFRENMFVEEWSEEIREKLEKLFMRFEVYDRFSKYLENPDSRFLPERFSGGQLQRLALIRALLLERELLLLDEATGNLDSKTEEMVLSYLKQTGKTIVFVTHRLKALEVSDRIYRVEKGYVFAEK